MRLHNTMTHRNERYAKTPCTANSKTVCAGCAEGTFSPGGLGRTCPKCAVCGEFAFQTKDCTLKSNTGCTACTLRNRTPHYSHRYISCHVVYAGCSTPSFRHHSCRLQAYPDLFRHLYPVTMCHCCTLKAFYGDGVANVFIHSYTIVLCLHSYQVRRAQTASMRL